MTDESIFAAALAIGSPSDRAKYLDRVCAGNSALRNEVEQLLSAHANSNPLDRPPGNLARTGAYEPQVDESGPVATVGDRVGPYKLLERIGEGGMGEVWVADQLEPIKRRVALKLIKPGMDSRSVLGRFEAERQALAVMDHPNIAKVLDAGTTADGRPFFVMELVKGTPITEFCDARKLTPKQRLELFIPVCQAIQHAHMKGIIHRDIKPSNVLVELYDDKAVAKVIDFGVAKAIGQQLTEKTIYTGFGSLVGTLAYMAPEQATFNALDVDTRADVYALGVLLYELLAGSPPIEAERLKKAALDEVLRIVRDEEPPRPSQRLSTSQAKATIAATRQSDPLKLSQLMKGELDWIVMKALEKDRTRRYDTANALAKDVQRYLNGDSVEACPPTLGYRLRKFYRRNRVPILTAFLFMVTLFVGSFFSIWQASRAMTAEAVAAQQRDEAIVNRGEAIAARQESDQERDKVGRANDSLRRLAAEQRRTLYDTSMNLAQAAWEAGDSARTFDLLRRQIPGPGEEDLRGFEWHYWNRFGHLDRKTVRLTGLIRLVSKVSLPTLSPDGTRVAGIVREPSSPMSVLKLLETETGRELWSSPVPAGVSRMGMGDTNFSLDGRRLATTRFMPGQIDRMKKSYEYELRIWDTIAGAVISVAPESGKMRITSNALTPDGSLLAYVAVETRDSNQIIQVIVRHLPDGTEVFRHRVGDPGLRSLRIAFSPDGKRLAAIVGPGQEHAPGTLHVWQIEAGQKVWEVWQVKLPDMTLASDLRYSPDGKRIAAMIGDENHQVLLLDAANGSTQQRIDALSTPNHRLDSGIVAFDETGTRLAITQNAQVLVCNVDPRQPTIAEPVVLTLRGHESPVQSLVFQRGGSGLVTADQGGTVKYWDVAAREPRLRMPLGGGITERAVLPNADWSRLAFLPSVQELAPVFRLTDGSGRALVEMTMPQGHSDSLTFSRDGRTLALVWHAGRNFTCYVWDAIAGKELRRFTWQDREVITTALSPDGSHLAVAITGVGLASEVGLGTITTWEVATGREKFSRTGLRVGNNFESIYSPDGRWIVMTQDAGGDARLVWLDAHTGTEAASLPVGDGLVRRPEFSRDGRYLTATRTVGTETTQPTWEVAPVLRGEAPAPTVILSGHGALITRASFSLDGRRILTSGGGVVKLWDAATGIELLNLKSTGARPFDACFSPDGNAIWGGLDENGRLWGWDGTPLTEAREP